MEMKLAIYAHQPQEVEHLPLDTVANWAKRNPASMTIWMIYCKKLLQLNHPDFKDVLRRTAFYCPNRAQLHRYLYDASWKLTNDLLPPINISTNTITNTDKDKSLEKDLLANAVSSSILMDVSEVEERPDLTNITDTPTPEVTHIQESSVIPKNDVEELDFIDWIKSKNTVLTVVKAPSMIENISSESKITIIPTPVNSTFHSLQPEKKQEPSIKLSKEELIQRFVTLEPKITPKRVEMYSPMNMAKKSTQEDYSLVTETLAKIYLAQSQYMKAKKSYESLSLRIPEKKSYFADQLKKIEALIHQKKNK